MARERPPAVVATRKRASRWLVLALQVGFFVLVTGTWQAGATTGWLDPFFFSKPSDIAGRMAEWILSGYIWPHLIVTLTEAMAAFAIGIVTGVLAGLALARVELLAAVFDPYIRIFNALPRVILAPILIIWFGLGMGSKIALGVTLVFFVVFFNTFQGVREVDPVVLNNARMLQASDHQLMRHVYLPSAMAWIFSSLHTSIGFALVGAVVGEYIGASQGIGYVVSQAQGVFDTTGVFAGLILTSIVVLCIDLAIEALERYLLRWRPQS
ncbi:NitT/TauT family transport system permease protein [Tistlia consotensis]|uniref:NitT/TauT family transport system permease protein n=1 Tax=Tistlia consotensis USBA 355 TaxID=560819 RepID=A0A1Y6BTT1_9PROT|nr:ABC transporter permease [Tistlia consotensis]SMF24899.1 NitT/TauT family transport system permease protein [Tistlia consotensis USBA 355]SNR60321.1 NitT/TauT family transport system permease protein [Tistlia consotensis]